MSYLWDALGGWSFLGGVAIVLGFLAVPYGVYWLVQRIARKGKK